jgi:hypothetical protein
MPYRLEHKRDSVRLKGGIEDYFVTAEIDFYSLRNFQRKNRMNDKNSELKPVAIGFQMSKFVRNVSDIYFLDSTDMIRYKMNTKMLIMFTQ